MRRFLQMIPLLAGLVLTACVGGAAQEDFLPVGEMAPDIELTGATRHGVLADPVKLSDLKGETVVLAFFFKARTGG